MTNILEVAEQKKQAVSLRLDTLNDILKQAKTTLEIEGALYTLLIYSERIREAYEELYKLSDKIKK